MAEHSEDFRFKLLKERVHILRPLEKASPKSSLICVSNTYGLVFVADNRTLRVIPTASLEPPDTGQAAINNLDIEYEFPPSDQDPSSSQHLALSSDEKLLLVVVGLQVLLFDVPSFVRSALEPIAVSTLNTPFLHALWSPDPTSQQMLLIGEDGSVEILDQNLAKVLSKPPNSCVSGAWSPTGKHYALIDTDGTITEYTTSLLYRNLNVIPGSACPADGFQACFVHYLNESTFGVGYVCPEANPGMGDRLAYCVVHDGKQDVFEDFAYPPFGLQQPRAVAFFAATLYEWDVALIATSMSTDITVVIKDKGLGSYKLLELDEDAKAGAPTSIDKGEDTFIQGLALDLNSTTSYPSSDPSEPPISPSPVLVLLTNEGALLPYALLNKAIPGPYDFIRKPVTLPSPSASRPKIPPTESSPPRLLDLLISAAGPQQQQQLLLQQTQQVQQQQRQEEEEDVEGGEQDQQRQQEDEDQQEEEDDLDEEEEQQQQQEEEEEEEEQPHHRPQQQPPPPQQQQGQQEEEQHHIKPGSSPSSIFSSSLVPKSPPAAALPSSSFPTFNTSAQQPPITPSFNFAAASPLPTATPFSLGPPTTTAPQQQQQQQQQPSRPSERTTATTTSNISHPSPQNRPIQDSPYTPSQGQGRVLTHNTESLSHPSTPPMRPPPPTDNRQMHQYPPSPQQPQGRSLPPTTDSHPVPLMRPPPPSELQYSRSLPPTDTQHHPSPPIRPQPPPTTNRSDPLYRPTTEPQSHPTPPPMRPSLPPPTEVSYRSLPPADTQSHPPTPVRAPPPPPLAEHQPPPLPPHARSLPTPVVEMRPSDSSVINTSPPTPSSSTPVTMIKSPYSSSSSPVTPPSATMGLDSSPKQQTPSGPSPIDSGGRKPSHTSSAPPPLKQHHTPQQPGAVEDPHPGGPPPAIIDHNRPHSASDHSEPPALIKPITDAGRSISTPLITATPSPVRPHVTAPDSSSPRPSASATLVRPLPQQQQVTVKQELIVNSEVMESGPLSSSSSSSRSRAAASSDIHTPFNTVPSAARPQISVKKEEIDVSPDSPAHTRSESDHIVVADHGKPSDGVSGFADDSDYNHVVEQQRGGGGGVVKRDVQGRCPEVSPSGRVWCSNLPYTVGHKQRLALAYWRSTWEIELPASETLTYREGDLFVFLWGLKAENTQQGRAVQAVARMAFVTQVEGRDTVVTEHFNPSTNRLESKRRLPLGRTDVFHYVPIPDMPMSLLKVGGLPVQVDPSFADSLLKMDDSRTVNPPKEVVSAGGNIVKQILVNGYGGTLNPAESFVCALFETTTATGRTIQRKLVRPGKGDVSAELEVVLRGMQEGESSRLVLTTNNAPPMSVKLMMACEAFPTDSLRPMAPVIAPRSASPPKQIPHSVPSVAAPLPSLPSSRRTQYDSDLGFNNTPTTTSSSSSQALPPLSNPTLSSAATIAALAASQRAKMNMTPRKKRKLSGGAETESSSTSMQSSSSAIVAPLGPVSLEELRELRLRYMATHWTYILSRVLDRLMRGFHVNCRYFQEHREGWVQQLRMPVIVLNKEEWFDSTRLDEITEIRMLQWDSHEKPYRFKQLRGLLKLEDRCARRLIAELAKFLPRYLSYTESFAQARVMASRSGESAATGEATLAFDIPSSFFLEQSDGLQRRNERSSMIAFLKTGLGFILDNTRSSDGLNWALHAVARDAPFDLPRDLAIAYYKLIQDSSPNATTDIIAEEESGDSFAPVFRKSASAVKSSAVGNNESGSATRTPDSSRDWLSAFKVDPLLCLSACNPLGQTQGSSSHGGGLSSERVTRKVIKESGKSWKDGLTQQQIDDERAARQAAAKERKRMRERETRAREREARVAAARRERETTVEDASHLQSFGMGILGSPVGSGSTSSPTGEVFLERRNSRLSSSRDELGGGGVRTTELPPVRRRHREDSPYGRQSEQQQHQHASSSWDSSSSHPTQFLGPPSPPPLAPPALMPPHRPLLQTPQQQEDPSPPAKERLAPPNSSPLPPKMHHNTLAIDSNSSSISPLPSPPQGDKNWNADDREKYIMDEVIQAINQMSQTNDPDLKIPALVEDRLMDMALEDNKQIFALWRNFRGNIYKFRHHAIRLAQKS